MPVFQNRRALLDRFRNGDKSALTDVYRYYVSDVEMVVRHGFFVAESNVNVPGVSDYETQKELIQDIFLRAFGINARLAYDGVRPYRAYLLRIARNIVIDYWRARSRDPLSRAPIMGRDGRQENEKEDKTEYLIEKSSMNPNFTGGEAEESLHWQRCLEASQAYIQSLDEMKQKLARLRFQERLPQEEVARQLKMTRWRVRSLEKKVESGLGKHLKKMGLLDG